jgi:hypothetical protein
VQRAAYIDLFGRFGIIIFTLIVARNPLSILFRKKSFVILALPQLVERPCCDPTKSIRRRPP